MTEVRIRRSFKWHVDAPGADLMLDYVFADNADEAVTKAYDLLQISPEISISVQRIPDVSYLSSRLNQESHATSRSGIAPRQAVREGYAPETR